MAFLVEIFRGRDEKNYLIKKFTFSDWEWTKLIELGVAHDWVQAGTIKPNDKSYINFKPDYIPDYPYQKIISAADAKQWALALIKVLVNFDDSKTHIEVKAPTLFKQDDSGEVSVKVSGISKKEIGDFADFLLGGDFCFWYDD